jgi:hypothetical protein
MAGATTPNTISDVRMECRREREWRVAAFHACPIFLGRDPYLNQLMSKDQEEGRSST